jgi:hypothetical protein
MENNKETGIITNFKRNRDRLTLEYNYDHLGKGHNDKKTVSSSLLRMIYRSKAFGDYYIGQKINVLIKPDNSFSFIENELNYEIFRRIILLLSLPFFVTILVWRFPYKNDSTNADKKTKKKSNKTCYKYYVQGKNHKIKEAIIGEEIDLDILVDNIDYDALRNDSIICCGIAINDDFVEISFSNDEYELRIFKNGDEKTETIKTIDDYSVINETIYKNLKKHTK